MRPPPLLRSAAVAASMLCVTALQAQQRSPRAPCVPWGGTAAIDFDSYPVREEGSGGADAPC